MRRDRLAAATELSAAFMPAEQAHLEATKLMAQSLVVALNTPAKAGLPVSVGAKAIAALARGVAVSAEARQAVIEAHAEFAIVVDELKLREKGWGCTGTDCPRVPGAEVHHLQPVSDAA